MTTVGSFVLAGALGFSACGSVEPAASDDYIALEAALAQAESDLSDAKAAAAEASTDADTANSDADAAKAIADASKADAEDAHAEAEAWKADAESARAEADAAKQDADTAKAEAERLLLQYDPQIRAELTAAVSAEIGRACGEAVANLDAPISDMLQYDTAWNGVTTRKDITAQIEACAAPERTKSAEQREAERFAAYGYLSVDEVVKNPEAFNGMSVLAFADIVQWDVNTGTCSFHANFLGEPGGRFDYDERGQFDADSSVCPALEGIDQDDIVKMWVTGTGSYTYSTSIGGSNSIPTFSIDKIELIEKN